MASERSTAGGDARLFRLGPRTRKGVLVVHIASAGGWLGLDVAMAVVIFTALSADDAGTRALCYQALHLFVIWPLFTAGIICLASGMLLGLGSKYGLVRYWWVAVKLALNIVLTGLAARRPATGRVRAERAGQGPCGRARGDNVDRQRDLSADRFPGRAAHRDGVGGVQAVGPDTQAARTRPVLSGARRRPGALGLHPGP